MSKTVDNFDAFSCIMHFDSPDDFYFVQIFVRRKDGHTEEGVSGNNKNRLVKIYTVRSVEELMRKKDEMIKIAEAVNGRVYAHPAKRSFKKAALASMKVGMEDIISENWDGLRNAYSHGCGVGGSEKLYVVDCDDIEIGDHKFCQIIDEINAAMPAGAKCVAALPTVHGCHVITKPFDRRTFGEKFLEIDVHKDNPTLLYYKEV